MTEQSEILASSIELLDRNSVVLDIGAYIGEISIYLCAITKGNPMNYHLVEACHTNYGILKLKCPYFNLYNCAISDKTGRQRFYSGNHVDSIGTSQANSLFKEFIDNKEWNEKTIEYEIETYTLDDFIEYASLSEIDYLKINCEGGEYKIFETSLNFLEKTKAIYLELHGKDPLFLTEEYRKKKRDINNLLINNGYTIRCGDGINIVDTTNTHTQQLWIKNG